MLNKIIYVLGITTLGVGIGFILLANVGYGPWDIFYANLVELFDSSFTVMQAVVSFTLVLSGFYVRRKKLDRSIIIITINSAYIAIWIDLMLKFNSPESTLVGYIMLLTGLMMVAIGVNMARFTQLVLPALDFFIQSLTGATRFNYGRIKQFLEVIVFILGVSIGLLFDLSFKIGFGTIIIMFMGGFFINLTYQGVTNILARITK